jgi:hypothetical protein
MLTRRKRSGKCVRFAEPPWNEDSPQWQEIDQELSANHVARVVVEQMRILDLSPLRATYLGTGSKPYPPELMLRIALIEIRLGRHSPTHWCRDACESRALQWAGWGIRPSRTCWYEFYDRAAPFLSAWNGMILDEAQKRGQTAAMRVALDGTLVAANASRHRLLNQERLEKRLAQLRAAIALDEPIAGEPSPDCVAPQTAPASMAPSPMGWMARTPAGRRQQRQRYGRAHEHLDELLAANARRNPAKRQDPKKIVVSGSDPQAALGRDKEKVFRPLYNVQLARDLDSPFILGYAAFAQTSDANTLGPLLERMSHQVGHKPEVVLADAGYVTGADLALCAVAGVTLYGPWQENDYSKRADKYLNKKQFQWLPDQNAYRCPQGQLLVPIGKETRKHVDGRSEVQYRFRCPPMHCRSCSLRQACTSNPDRGRSLRRSEHEDLIEAHKARMATWEAKELYKLRKQTVELGFADLKEHRRLRRLWGRGLGRAQAQLGFAVLANNVCVAATSPAPQINGPELAASHAEKGP